MPHESPANNPPPPPPEGTAAAGDESAKSTRQAIIADGLKAAAIVRDVRGIVEQATTAMDRIGMALAEGWWDSKVADAAAAAAELTALRAAAQELAEACRRAAAMYRAHTPKEG